jgi:hypothetical protein
MSVEKLKYLRKAVWYDHKVRESPRSSTRVDDWCSYRILRDIRKIRSVKKWRLNRSFLAFLLWTTVPFIFFTSGGFILFYLNRYGNIRCFTNRSASVKNNRQLIRSLFAFTLWKLVYSWNANISFFTSHGFILYHLHRSNIDTNCIITFWDARLLCTKYSYEPFKILGVEQNQLVGIQWYFVIYF